MDNNSSQTVQKKKASFSVLQSFIVLFIILQSIAFIPTTLFLVYCGPSTYTDGANYACDTNYMALEKYFSVVSEWKYFFSIPFLLFLSSFFSFSSFDGDVYMLCREVIQIFPTILIYMGLFLTAFVYACFRIFKERKNIKYFFILFVLLSLINIFGHGWYHYILSKQIDTIKNNLVPSPPSILPGPDFAPGPSIQDTSTEGENAQVPEIKTFLEGNTTIRIEEFGEPFTSFYSLPYLSRYHISNSWGAYIFEPVSEERSGKTTYGRGKPDKISLSQTGRFIGFNIPFGDGSSIPVIYDMKSGKDILSALQKSTGIVTVSDFIWLPGENSFLFLSHFNGYSGEGTEDVYYWHEKSPETLTSITSLSRAEGGRLSDASYSNLRLLDGHLYVDERGHESEQVTVRTFALP